MSRRPRGLSPEELDLWRRVAATTRPLPGARLPQRQAHVEVPRVRPVPPVLAAPAPPCIGKPVTSPAPDRGGEKRVRRGRLEIWDSLDLHGLTQERAQRAVHAFLMRAAADGGRVVVVVTGKGGRLVSGEAAPGVLRARLPDWLNDPSIRAIVSGFAQAHRQHGGAGAFYVFLKAPRED